MASPKSKIRSAIIGTVIAAQIVTANPMGMPHDKYKAMGENMKTEQQKGPEVKEKEASKEQAKLAKELYKEYSKEKGIINTQPGLFPQLTEKDYLEFIKAYFVSSPEDFLKKLKDAVKTHKDIDVEEGILNLRFLMARKENTDVPELVALEQERIEALNPEERRKDVREKLNQGLEGTGIFRELADSAKSKTAPTLEVGETVATVVEPSNVERLNAENEKLRKILNDNKAMPQEIKDLINEDVVGNRDEILKRVKKARPMVLLLIDNEERLRQAAAPVKEEKKEEIAEPKKEEKAAPAVVPTVVSEKNEVLEELTANKQRLEDILHGKLPYKMENGKKRFLSVSKDTLDNIELVLKNREKGWADEEFEKELLGKLNKAKPVVLLLIDNANKILEASKATAPAKEEKKAAAVVPTVKKEEKEAPKAEAAKEEAKAVQKVTEQKKKEEAKKEEAKAAEALMVNIFDKVNSIYLNDANVRKDSDGKEMLDEAGNRMYYVEPPPNLEILRSFGKIDYEALKKATGADFIGMLEKSMAAKEFDPKAKSEVNGTILTTFIGSVILYDAFASSFEKNKVDKADIAIKEYIKSGFAFSIGLAMDHIVIDKQEEFNKDIENFIADHMQVNMMFRTKGRITEIDEKAGLTYTLLAISKGYLQHYKNQSVNRILEGNEAELLAINTIMDPKAKKEDKEEAQRVLEGLLGVKLDFENMNAYFDPKASKEKLETAKKIIDALNKRKVDLEGSMAELRTFDIAVSKKVADYYNQYKEEDDKMGYLEDFILGADLPVTGRSKAADIKRQYIKMLNDPESKAQLNIIYQAIRESQPGILTLEELEKKSNVWENYQILALGVLKSLVISNLSGDDQRVFQVNEGAYSIPLNQIYVKLGPKKSTKFLMDLLDPQRATSSNMTYAEYLKTTIMNAWKENRCLGDFRNSFEAANGIKLDANDETIASLSFMHGVTMKEMNHIISNEGSLEMLNTKLNNTRENIRTDLKELDKEIKEQEKIVNDAKATIYQKNNAQTRLDELNKRKASASEPDQIAIKEEMNKAMDLLGIDPLFRDDVTRILLKWLAMKDVINPATMNKDRITLDALEEMGPDGTVKSGIEVFKERMAKLNEEMKTVKSRYVTSGIENIEELDKGIEGQEKILKNSKATESEKKNAMAKLEDLNKKKGAGKKVYFINEDINSRVNIEKTELANSYIDRFTGNAVEKGYFAIETNMMTLGKLNSCSNKIDMEIEYIKILKKENSYIAKNPQLLEDCERSLRYSKSRLDHFKDLINKNGGRPVGIKDFRKLVALGNDNMDPEGDLFLLDLLINGRTIIAGPQGWRVDHDMSSVGKQAFGPMAHYFMNNPRFLFNDGKNSKYKHPGLMQMSDEEASQSSWNLIAGWNWKGRESTKEINDKVFPKAYDLWNGKYNEGEAAFRDAVNDVYEDGGAILTNLMNGVSLVTNFYRSMHPEATEKDISSLKRRLTVLWLAEQNLESPFGRLSANEGSDVEMWIDGIHNANKGITVENGTIEKFMENVAASEHGKNLNSGKYIFEAKDGKHDDRSFEFEVTSFQGTVNIKMSKETLDYLNENKLVLYSNDRIIFKAKEDIRGKNNEIALKAGDIALVSKSNTAVMLVTEIDKEKSKEAGKPVYKSLSPGRGVYLIGLNFVPNGFHEQGIDPVSYYAGYYRAYVDVPENFFVEDQRVTLVNNVGVFNPIYEERPLVAVKVTTPLTNEQKLKDMLLDRTSASGVRSNEATALAEDIGFRVEVDQRDGSVTFGIVRRDNTKEVKDLTELNAGQMQELLNELFPGSNDPSAPDYNLHNVQVRNSFMRMYFGSGGPKDANGDNTYAVNMRVSIVVDRDGNIVVQTKDASGNTQDNIVITSEEITRYIYGYAKDRFATYIAQNWSLVAGKWNIFGTTQQGTKPFADKREAIINAFLSSDIAGIEWIPYADKKYNVSIKPYLIASFEDIFRENRIITMGGGLANRLAMTNSSVDLTGQVVAEYAPLMTTQWAGIPSVNLTHTWNVGKYFTEEVGTTLRYNSATDRVSGTIFGGGEWDLLNNWRIGGMIDYNWGPVTIWGLSTSLKYKTWALSARANAQIVSEWETNRWGSVKFVPSGYLMLTKDLGELNKTAPAVWRDIKDFLQKRRGGKK